MGKKCYLITGTWGVCVWAESEEDALQYFAEESTIDDFDIDTSPIHIEEVE